MKKNIFHTRCTLALMSGLTGMALIGCSTPPPYQKPVVEVPAVFKESSLWKSARPDLAAVPDNWWLLFNDPVLNELQKQVMVGNENLKASAAQYQVARAALGSSRAALLPTLGTSAGATHSVVPGGITPATSYSVAASASWELDLWGRVAGTVSNAQARAQASAADLDAARLSIQATLAQTYFSLRAASRWRPTSARWI